MKTPATHDESPIWRRKRTKDFLGVCESQLLKFEKRKLLTPIKPDGLRVVWYDAEQVKRLAEQIRTGKLPAEAAS